MGNRICGLGRRGAVEERLTRPQRLARQPSNVDYRKLRKLILSRKLAPCFDALEDPASDLEECPICFFYYPSLNRSRCCSKGICTECFLQMKPSSAVRPAQCPFCKTFCYAVEYRGARSKEEKELELAEEQKVIEAKIRMQSQESLILEQAVAVNRTCSTSDVESPRPCEGEQSTGDLPVTRDLAVASMREDTEADYSLAPDICNARFEEWDVDLEEIMVMEAIWQSLQDSKTWTNGTPEASRAGGGLICGEKSEVNQSMPTCPSFGECEASSSCACPHSGPVEDYASRLEASEPMCDGGHKRSCEDSADESDGTEIDIDCLENFSSEHDPSWRSTQVVQDTHLRASAQASAFATDSFSSSAKAETGSCFSSYVDSDTSSSCDSPTFSNSDMVRGFPQLPALLVEQPMMIVTESSCIVFQK